MSPRAILIAVALLAAVSLTAAAQAKGKSAAPFARLEAPVGKAWTPPERWSSETIEGRKARRLTTGNAYARAKAVGAIPTTGSVMLEVQYHAAAGESFFIGLGSWGSPLKEIIPQVSGWQTSQVVFPARSLNRDRTA
ncbi:hypothetical protein LCGC14_2927060, partial [marine sediment metagenome]